MSTSRKSKKDIDRYVRQIDEKERGSRGYQIALLYYEVSEYDLARRYLAGYMSLRETVPQAHKLMGQIFEATKEFEQAVACYKRSLELDNKQRELILKVCELYSKIPNTDVERLKYWSERAEKYYPNNRVIFGIKEKILTNGSGGSLEEMEEFYAGQLVKNFTNVSLHIKLLDLYMTAEKVQNAYNHAMDVENTLAFVNNIEWNEYLPRVLHAYQKKEPCGNNIKFHRHKLFILMNLLKLQLQQKDIVTCVTTLHQFDQGLYDALQVNSKKPEWIALLSEMQGQYFFNMAVLLIKRAQKGQQLWKDASSFSSICFLLSNYYTALDTKTPWYVQAKQEDTKFYDKLKKAGCYRLSQGGHMMLSVMQSEGVARIQHLKQNLRTQQARDKLYDIIFTLREMRETKNRSYLIKTDVYCKTPLVPPSQSAVAEWDNVVHQDCIESLPEHVWIALNKYSPKDKTQPDYGMKMFEKLPYRDDDITNGSPESLDVLDVQAFFYATVRCAALSYEEQRKTIRNDPHKLYLLPSCLTQQLVTKQQIDWWEAVCKFYAGTAREHFAKLRVTLQKGIETIRLLGNHGMSVIMIVHLARTFDERLKEMEKQIEEGQQGLEVKIRALQSRVVYYWKEALTVLAKLQKNMPVRMPKERMFSDTQSEDCDSNQVQYLIDQAKFAIATIAMKKGQFEEAKEQFEKLNQPWSSYNLSQIYRKLSDNVSGNDPDLISQKTALLESALDALYLTHDRLQGDKNDELNRRIPADIDDVVNQLERLRTSGPALVDSISGIEEDRSDSNDDTPSFSTPQGKDRSGRSMHGESPSFMQAFERDHSTPSIKGKSPNKVHFSVISEPSQRPRPSPERLEAKIWALEMKQQTILDLLQDIKDRSNEMNRVIKEVREEQETYRDVVKQMREYMAVYPPTHGQFMNPAFGVQPYGYPPQPSPHPAAHQQPWIPPANLGYPMSPRPGSTFGGSARLDRFSTSTHQNDIVEDDIYHVDGEYYEDDGSQPLPEMFNRPDSQLEQNWPFGHRAGLEGKATVTYSPQGRPIPQPGFFAQALRGQALQYGFQQPGPQAALQRPNAQPRNPLTVQQPANGGMIGPGFFSQQPQFPISSQTQPPRSSDTYQNTSSYSQPSALIAALQGTTAVATSTTMPPNAVATSSIMVRPSLIQGTSGVSSQQIQVQGQNITAPASQGQSLFGNLDSVTSSATGSPLPLFGSLVAAAKSPSEGTSQVAAPSPLASFAGLKPTTSTSQPSGFPSFSSLSAAAAVDSNAFTPQQGFTGFQDSGRPLFIKGGSPGKSPTKSPSKYGCEDDHIDEFEPNVDFKPVIDLPELVDIRTGEEDEDKLFGERAKLFRFDGETKQWKERGVGEIKLLKHKETEQVRILMRREQVFKICANHFMSKHLELTPMPSSDRAWCWTVMDYSEEESKQEKFCIRFKNVEIAEKFKEVFEKCQEELRGDKTITKPRDDENTSTAATGQPALNLTFKPKAGPDAKKEEIKQEKSKTVNPKGTTSGQPKLKDLFKPKAGSWSCSTCLVSNNETSVKCAACGTLKPGARPEDVKQEKPSSKTSSTTGKSSLGDLFKPKAGSWSCNTCLVSNNADTLKCAACGTLKPGVKPEDVKEEKSDKPKFTFKVGGGFTTSKDAASTTSTEGFKFGSSGPSETTATTGGFKFGETKQAASSSGFRFGQTPQVKTGEATQSDADSTTGFKFGETKAASPNVPGITGGFKFGETKAGDGGFNFGTAKVSSDDKSETVTTKQADSDKSTQQSEKSVTLPKLKAVPVKPSSKFADSKPTAGASSISFVLPATEGKPAGSGFSFGTPSSGFKFGQSTANEGFNFGKPKDDKSKEESASIDFTITDTHSDDETKEPEVRTGTFTFNPKDLAPKSDEKPKFTITSSKIEDQGTSSTSPFKFTFTAKLTSDETNKEQVLKSPKSPGTDPDGMYVNKEGEDDHIYFEPLVKLDHVEVVTGEEDETVLYEHRAKLYRFTKGEWKERGLGNVKILENKQSKQIRLLMRREKILKICCNHYINSELELKPMPKADGKAWVWYAMDFSEDEPQCEQLSIRFKTADIANDFKRAFDLAKEKTKSSKSADTPKKGDSSDNTQKSPTIATRKLFTEDDTDVIFVKEEKATEEQIQRARKFMLPDHFYLYESKPPCSGCIGCNDTEAETFLSSPVRPKKDLSGSGPTDLFGGAKTESSKIFGSSSPEKVFGGEISSTTSSGSTPIFGAGATGGIFGGVTATESTSGGSGLFGSITTGGGSVFGGSKTPDTASGGASVFGSGASGSVFGGGKPSESSSGAGLFSSAATGGLFGKGGGDTGFSFASLAANSDNSVAAFKRDDNKPFVWSGAGQTLFKSVGRNGDGPDEDDDDGGDVESGHDPHFEAIVPLPELVEVKTGEEDEDPVFAHRAKLFRFDKDTKQWKEKGLGEMKILKCKFTGKYRLLLRREQVYKLACNHSLTPELDFKLLPTSETSYCWVAEDFSDNVGRVEQFAVRFKTIDLARQFKDKIDECQEELRNARTEASPVVQITEDKKPIQATGGDQDKDKKEEGKVDDDEEDDDEAEDDDDDEYETEEEEVVIFEKRVTFSSKDKGQANWKAQGIGDLKVYYDDDVNGNRVVMVTDKDDKVCNHLIAKENVITLNSKQRYCEWSAVDFSTDEPMRREFRAQFSSGNSAEEFQNIFQQGRSLAVDSDISERDMMSHEIDIPEVHSHNADLDE